jgi:predicted alpha/beta-hydrolase family hydrolase
VKQSTTSSWVTARGGLLLFGVLLVSACGSDSGTSPFDVGADDDTDTDTDTDTDNASEDDDDDEDDDVKIDASAPSKPSTAKPTADAGKSSADARVTSGQDSGSSSKPGSDEGGGGSPDPTGSGSSSCLDGVTDFNKEGAFKYTAQPQGAIKFWVPEVPAGCKVPVVHLANGTGASCAAYQSVLNRLASHGFLAACYESTQTGAGTQGLMAFETALSKFPDLADKKFGSTGHSQGGQAAFVVLQLAEAKFGDEGIYAGLAMEPASGFGDRPAGGSWQSVYAKIKSPMFMFSGTSDTLVSAAWVAQGFAALDDGIEAYNWSARGATHIPTPQTETMEVSIPWFRWKLLGDKAACMAFQALKGAGRWTETKSQNAKGCE